MLGNREKCVVSLTAERQFGNESGAPGASCGLDTVLKIVEERFPPSFVVVPRRDEHQLRRQDVRGIEPEMNAHQPPETVEQKARGNQHYHRECYLRDDQHIVRAMLRTRITGSAAFSQALRHIPTACFERRPQTEQYPCEYRGYERESQHDTAHIYFIETRKTLRTEPLQKFHASV